MQITTETLDDGITKVQLDGQLDIMGSQAVDTKLRELAADSNGIVVDMSNVSFLASIGIRSLVMTTKALHQRNKQLVILNPQDVVVKVLRTAGIDKVIPIHTEEDAALAELTS